MEWRTHTRSLLPNGFFHLGAWLTPSVAEGKKGLQGFRPLTGSDRVRKGFGALPQQAICSHERSEVASKCRACQTPKDMINLRYHIF